MIIYWPMPGAGVLSSIFFFQFWNEYKGLILGGIKIVITIFLILTIYKRKINSRKIGVIFSIIFLFFTSSYFSNIYNSLKDVNTQIKSNGCYLIYNFSDSEYIYGLEYREKNSSEEWIKAKITNYIPKDEIYEINNNLENFPGKEIDYQHPYSKALGMNEFVHFKLPKNKDYEFKIYTCLPLKTQTKIENDVFDTFKSRIELTYKTYEVYSLGNIDLNQHLDFSAFNVNSKTEPVALGYFGNVFCQIDNNHRIYGKNYNDFVLKTNFPSNTILSKKNQL